MSVTEAGAAESQLTDTQPRPRALSGRRRSGHPGRKRDPVAKLFLGVVVLVLLLLVGIPVVTVLSQALTPGGLEVLAWFSTSQAGHTIFLNTVVLGISVGAVGTVIAFILAYAQARMRFPGQRIIHVLTLVPIISPPFAVAAATIHLFGRRGIISWGIFGERSDVIYGLPGLTFVLALSYLPLAYLNLLGMLRALDPAHEEAASSLGASKFRIFRTVTLPMLVPGFGAAFLLLFVEAISDLSNPLVLGGDYHVLASRAYLAISGGGADFTRGAVYALLLMIPAVLVFAIQRYWAGRGAVVSITGKPTGTHLRERSKAVLAPVLTVVYAVAGVILLLYGTIVLGAFVPSLGQFGSLFAALRNGEGFGEAAASIEFTSESILYVLTGAGQDAVFDTVRLAIIATPLAGLLGMIIAWLVVTRMRRGNALLDFAGMLGLAIPGTVLGIGYVLAYSSPTTIAGVTVLPQLVFGSAFLGGAAAIVMAYAAGSSPAGQRSGIAALRQLDLTLEEASQSLGVSTAGTFRKITLPLIRPAFMVGLMYAFAQAMTSVSAIIFLQTAHIDILTFQIYTEIERARYTNAFAFCVVLMVIVLTAMLIIHWVTAKRTNGMRSR